MVQGGAAYGIYTDTDNASNDCIPNQTCRSCS